MRLTELALDQLDTVTDGENLVTTVLAEADKCYSLANSLLSKETSLGVDEATRTANHIQRITRCGDAAVAKLLAAPAPNNQ